MIFGLKMKTPALVERLRATEREAQEQISRLEQRQVELNTENLGLASGEENVETARKRARLRAEYEAAEVAKASLSRQVDESRRQQQETLENYERLQGERKKIVARLSQFAPGEYDDELLGRLAQVLRALSHLEQSPALQVEAEEILRDIAQRSAYHVMDEAWHRDETGRLVRESEFTGSGVQVYGKGVRVLKTELIAAGILEGVR